MLLISTTIKKKAITQAELDELVLRAEQALAWMEQLRTGGDAGNWEWHDDEYTRLQEVLRRLEAKTSCS